MAIPGCFLTWDTSVNLLNSRTDSLIKKARAVYDQIGSVSNPTWGSVAQSLSYFEAEYSVEKEMLTFPQYVFPDKSIRDASCDAARKISDVEVELEMRKDVFDQFVHIQSHLDSTVPAEMKRYVDRKVRDGRRAGRKKIEELSKEENRLCIDFQRALDEENTMPSGKLQITLKYPHYFPASEKASNPATRRALEKAFNSRCIKENTPILKRLMELRKERSSMLGFPTHADFTVDIRMAKTAAIVDAFLKDVAQKLEPIRSKDSARVLQLKKEECERLGYPFVNRIEPSDLRYYINLIKEKDYAVDHHHLKKYFPLRAVKAGVLRLYQHLLGLTFARVNTTDVWHPDVEMYSVTDTDTKELLGYMYLDLHPREGKFGHAAVFGLQPGCLRRKETASGEDVERQVAVAAIVANFTGPSTAQSEAYLLHDEVNTFFHEFGHLMHAICARTDCQLFSGTHVETDFVECPSQMLENWVWNADGLKALLGEEAEQIPKELLDRLLASRKATAGLFYTRQVLLATFDQAIHTTHWNSDPYEVYVEFSRKLCDIDPTPGTCVPASFGHLAGGYDARYYGYLWSEVFSADLYESRFRRAPDGGCLSKTVGREYRTKILQPGGSKDASDMLRDFLGRDPNNSAFFKLLGIQV
ncbi:hypothetical protein CRM22_000320 [Opisthorchis felineus]|uniref:Peptidase M3A/M3B catalytic domain-containing protein n=1 Tax=Opisthorchis felineus TaxID=147828 RepID=A0A4S2MMH5_OPIFE|nr:hypothetical protein CRM22_000320 [Opisthorchis felineus]